MMHNIEADNFDGLRYPESARNAFYYQLHAKYLEHLVTNIDAFHAARNLLEDEESRLLFDRLILYRMLGHLHVRLPFNNPGIIDRLRVPENWKVDDTGDAGMFGPLSVYSVPFLGTNVWVKCWEGNVAATFLSGQYHFDRDGIQIAPQPGDHVIDAGGCFGDTAIAFAAEVGPSGSVYTFDPLAKHCEIISEVCLMNSQLASRVNLFKVGLSSTDYAPAVASEVDNSINPGARLTDAFPTCTVDSAVDRGRIARVDFIKMDIEGSELAALKGAEASIRRWRPRLAISLYHRPEDFHAIPLWLQSLDCGYHFYLDHYSIHQEETVLYARCVQ